jgi:hypothetical protein
MVYECRVMLTVNITINECVLDSNNRVFSAVDTFEISTEFLYIISLEVILQRIKLTRLVSSGDIWDTHKCKISAKTQQFYFIITAPGLHVSTPSSHHQAPQGTDPRLSKFSCTLWSQSLTIGFTKIIPLIVVDWDLRVHENLDNLGSAPWRAWWWLEGVETCSPGVVVIK